MKMIMKSAAVVLSAAVTLLALGTVGHGNALGGDLLARFEGGVGVNPVAGVAGPQNADGPFQNVIQNVVRGIKPAAAAWRIDALKAGIDTAGRITVRGSGLRLAAGDRIGQSLQLHVSAVLICEPAAPFVVRTTSDNFQLDVNGDFRIDDTLSPVPSECASPVLLIRAGLDGPWLAAGFLAAEIE